jgi:hypothetical protein
MIRGIHCCTTILGANLSPENQQVHRQYRTQDDGDEFSNYLLRFRLTRRVVVSG